MQLSDLKDVIYEFINKKKKTEKSTFKMKEKVSKILLQNNKVFKTKDDKDELVPYIILDDNSISEFDAVNNEIKSLFSCTFGIDLYQNKFARELFNYIRGKICIEGDLKVLHKYTHVEDNILYSSCGRHNIITTDNSTMNLTKYKMGHNDIYFNPEYVLPEWNVVGSNSLFDDEKIFDQIKAFNITPYMPDGLNIFTTEMQIYALKQWIISAFIKIKPFPILLFYGNKSSGKTLTSKAIMKLFMGDNKNVSISPDNKRSLMSCITEHFIYTIDNLDSKVAPWFNDTLTLASTGGEISERALFTNSKVYRKDIISSVIITSRNPSFAKREDIKDRILPIFLDDRTDYSYSEDSLLKEILNNRDAILSELFKEAQLFLTHLKSSSNKKFEHKYRFTSFGKLLEFNLPNTPNINFTVKELITSITSAQFNSLTDIDPIIQHILEFDYSEIKCIEHTPKEIIDLLKLENIKPRVLSRKLKENSDIFVFNGWNVKSEKFGHSTKYFIYPPNYTDPI